MEMIAMLGGFGAGPYIEKPSEKAVGVIAAIRGAKKVEEIDSILNGLPMMGLAANELAVLQFAAMAKREDIVTPFWKKGSYWLKVAAVVGIGYVGYRYYKGKPIFPGLSGLSGRAPATPKSVEGVDKQGRRVKLVVKKDRDWGEWQVRVYVNGKFSDAETGYMGSDKEDALSAFADMKRHYGLAGLGAGWGASDKYKINPGSRKGTAANPKAGYSRSFDPHGKEKELIGRMDDARYHARKKAKGLRRKARTEARKAGR